VCVCARARVRVCVCVCVSHLDALFRFPLACRGAPPAQSRMCACVYGCMYGWMDVRMHACRYDRDARHRE